MSKAPALSNSKPLVAIKGYPVSAIRFENKGGSVVSCSVSPALPAGLSLIVENNTCVLVGRPRVVSANAVYQVSACNDESVCATAMIDIAVHEAPIREQRGEIIKIHDKRHDLDTPRSQVEHALSDSATFGSMIKPHEKFLKQPLGDDSHLTAQAANNPDAEQRAEATPELTPSPSAQLQHQAILAAKPTITPTPTPTR